MINRNRFHTTLRHAFKAHRTNRNYSTQVKLQHNTANDFIPAPLAHRILPLDVSLLEIDKAETAKARFNDISEVKTKLKVNYLYNAILNNENTVAIKLLNDFMNKSQEKFLSDINLHIFLSGLSLYLSKLAAEKEATSVSIIELRQIVNCFARFLSIISSKKNQKVIQNLNPDLLQEVNQLVELCCEKLVVSVTYSYHVTSMKIPNKSFNASILQFIRSLSSKLTLEPSQYVNSFDSIAMKMVYCHIFEVPESFVKDKTDVAAISPDPYQLQTSIEPYLNDNMATFGSLCDYIEGTRFTEYDENDMPKKPMFQIYQELQTKREKDEFMEKYLAFNEHRQLNVENHCECLFNETSVHLLKFQLPGYFNQRFYDLVFGWHQNTLSAFHQLSETFDLINSGELHDLDEDEKAVYAYAAQFNMIPKETLLSLIFSSLISSTVTSKNGHVTLLSLVQSLRKKINKLLSTYQELSPGSEYINKFFTTDDSIIYFSSLLNITMRNCRIDSERIEKALFLQSLQFIDELTIDEKFTESSDESYPAFIHGMIHSKNISVGVIKIHPYLLQVMKDSDEIFTSDSIYFPMLSPPKPWTNYYNGGYLTDLKDMVTHPQYQVMRHYFKSANESGQLRSIYQSLSVLGETKWTVNRNVFESLQKVFEYNDGFLKIPPSLSHLGANLTPKPKIEDYDNGEDYKKACFRVNYINKEKLSDFYDIKSQRIQFNMTFNVAKSLYENGDIFFLPHQLDFRGRAYPSTSCLNHHGEDYVRALLMFWDSKPLGKQGFNWLKYQLAGLYGFDKLDMSERVAFVDNNLSEIIDSAKNPLNGKMWWTKAEKPWQTLALCHEINDIINHIDAGHEVSEFGSRIPIHQDGSCNGFQHYAALGLDSAGAKVVNLLPGERMDIYTVVLDLVKKSVEKELETGSDYFELAELSLKILNRKMVKQTVMTSVYGVTHFGAKEQVSSRIKELINDATVQLKAGHSYAGIDDELLKRIEDKRASLASFISIRILQSIHSLFPNAKLLQLWLMENCQRVVTAFRKGTSGILQKGQKGTKFLQLSPYQSMIWTSMSGFPVVQLYRHFKHSNVKTTLQNISIIKPYKFTSVDVRRQLNGIAPNFVHSIDATHLLMTSTAAKKSDILFASVHDSFWTHPSEVPELSKLIREEFVRLHTSDNISNLRLNLQHLGQDLLQVVWVDNSENPEFIEQLNKERSKITKRPNHTQWSKCLFKELDNPDSVINLYKIWKPNVYYKPNATVKTGYLYSESSKDVQHSVDIHYKTHTPILVPVTLLECPSTGLLDIKQVLHSKYFFS